MPEQDDVTRDPTGRLTVNKAGTYRVTMPMFRTWEQALDWQKERIAALEAALHALVDDDDALGWWDEEGSLRCPHCAERLYEGKVSPQHAPDCPIVKARALLGKGEG